MGYASPMLPRHKPQVHATVVHGNDNVMPPANTPEPFSRVIIDALLKDSGWHLTDGRSVRFEYMLTDGTKADYVLFDRHGRALAKHHQHRADLARLGRSAHVVRLYDESEALVHDHQTLLGRSGLPDGRHDHRIRSADFRRPVRPESARRRARRGGHRFNGHGRGDVDGWRQSDFQR